jgi:hypothetical protein
MRTSGLLLFLGLFAGIIIFFVPVLFLPSDPDEAGAGRRYAKLRQRFDTLRSKLADIKATKLADLKARERLKRMFAKRRRLSSLNRTSQQVERVVGNSTTNLTNRTLKLQEDAARLPHWNFDDITDMFEMLDSAAQREAHQMGLVAPLWKRKKGPPPLSEVGASAIMEPIHRAHYSLPLPLIPDMTDAELVGPEPVRMFTLLHVSHHVCEATDMDNKTLAMTLELCATRCLLATREGSGRSCSHFAWLPKLQQCALYETCKTRISYEHQARLYEKSA